jgi:acetyl-CoA carboxylase carboxyltransferase component
LALQEGYVDKEIEPNNTRREIFEALKMLRGKEKNLLEINKRHNNMPL